MPVAIDDRGPEQARRFESVETSFCRLESNVVFKIFLLQLAVNPPLQIPISGALRTIARVNQLVHGQGVQIGDKIAGPLWGPRSWNDGAGAARVYTLAGMIRYSMPYLDPGNMTDEDAQQLAAFIDSKPRPVFPFKEGDYRTEKLPPDAVYYAQR